MPRFFFDIYNSIVVLDEEGHELPDLEAVRREVRGTLPRIIEENIAGKDKSHARVDVRDAAGRRVLTSTAVMVIDCIEDPA